MTKNLLKFYSSTKKGQIFTILFLTSILSVSSELLLIESSSAAINHMVPTLIAQLFPADNSRELPRAIAQAIFSDLSRTQGIPASKLKVIGYSQRTWRNGCLEMPQRQEFCTQAVVDGWQVIVTDDRQKWVYHTNSNGSALRLANTNIPQNKQTVSLPVNISNAILKTSARRLNLPLSQLVIMQVSRQTWRDGCLELAAQDQSCTTALVPGWKVIVGAPEQTLVYHLNQTGSIIKLNEPASEISITKLPSTVSDAVIRDAEQRLGVNKSQLSIIKTRPITTNSCLNLPLSGELCTQTALKAWQVSVTGDQQSLVYHANDKQVRLNVVASRITLPASVTQGVLRQASQVSGLPAKSLRIVKSQPQQWDRNCLNRQSCDSIKIPGWEVVVATDKQNLVFLSDGIGKLIVQQVNNSGTPSSVKLSQNVLPQNIAERVLAQASQDSKLPVSKLQIIAATPQKWTDTCLGMTEQYALCNAEIVPGWQVTVSDGQNTRVYRVGELVKISLSSDPQPINNNRIPKPATVKPGVVFRQIIPTTSAIIPSNELPSPLESGVIFRQIVSGGLTGKTEEIVLLDNGRLIHSQNAPIVKVSPQKLREFKQLLENKNFGEFTNHSFPAPVGAADYITYTLTTGEGTVQYSELSQNILPENLRAVVDAWNNLQKK